MSGSTDRLDYGTHPFKKAGVFNDHSLSHTPKKPAAAPPPTELTAPMMIWASRLFATAGLGCAATAETAPMIAPDLQMASMGAKMLSMRIGEGHERGV